jgi:type I restriction enzyme R subunit
MNEAETRAELIDPLLAAAGWGVVEGSRIRREFSITPGRIEGGGRRGKSLSADYVLTYRNTALAVVEAKADSQPLSEGVGQAKDYAAKLQIRFTYASNGRASTPSIGPRARRRRSPVSPPPRSCGSAPSPRRTPGGIASPPFPIPTRVAAGRSASTRTLP